jgi:Ala-tRNA(Pro) deacylase
MAISKCLKDYLDSHGVDYQVTTHSHTGSSSETAEAAHISGDQLAKSILVEDENGYFLVVVPASHRVDLGALHRKLHRQVGLATEEELQDLFADCDVGAIPPVGEAFGIPSFVDTSLDNSPDVYFEAGDHEALVHMSGQQFRQLTNHAQHLRISHHV